MKIFLIGFMGSGKTYWGQKLSRKLSLPFFDLDEQIINSEGRSVNDIFEQDGEEFFRKKEREILFMISESHESFILACGGGTPCYFNNIEYMNQNGTTVWLNTGLPVLYERLIQEKEQRPLLKNLGNEQLKAYINKKYSDRKIYYEQATVVIENEDISEDQFIEKIFHA